MRIPTFMIAALVMASAAPAATRAEWWQQAKFGMFIHWGIYSVPADPTNRLGFQGAPEWYLDGKFMPVAEYEKFAPQFNPAEFDARAWVRVAKEAGMKYITVTAKHHDGFCMFDSKLTDYDIVDATPYKKDPLKELAEACREEGIRLQFYYSIMDWHHPDYLPRRVWESRPVGDADLNRYIDYMKGQLGELLTNYGDIAGIWFDGGWDHDAKELRSAEINAFMRSIKQDLMINNRSGLPEDYDTPEQTIPAAPPAGRLWETCMTLNDYWGYARNDDSWKSSTDLIRKLCDIASKGGNFLLNVGPDERGVIPAPSVERLKKVGEWMRVNGESIYGATRSPYRRYDFNGRCTAKGNTLYVHVFGWPNDGVTVRGLKSPIISARLLASGSDAEVRSASDAAGMSSVTILPPAQRDYAATVIALELAGPVEQMVTAPPLRPDPHLGTLDLSAADATTHGSALRLEKNGSTENLGWWTNAQDWASWDIEVPAGSSRDYAVHLTYACESGHEGGRFAIASSAASATGVAGVVEATRDWGDFHAKRDGTLRLSPGRQTISIKAVSLGAGGALMNLAQLRLEPLKDQTSARQRVKQAKSYFCYYGANKVDELSKYDFVLLHTPAATPQTVHALKQRGVVTIGYISCGEDETLRAGDGSGPGGKASWYFDKDKDGQPDSHGIWKSYFTNAADPKWRADRVAEARRLVKEVGFDGIFLDTVDDVTIYPETFEGMVQLIEQFRRELPDAPIIMNQSWELLRRLAPQIDGVMLESFTTSYDFENQRYRRNPLTWDDASLASVKTYVLPARQEHGLQVIVLDYAGERDAELHQAASDRAASLGFLHCIAPISLEEIYQLKIIPRPNEKYLARQSTPESMSVKLDAPRNGFPAGTIVLPSDCFLGYTVAPIVDGVADHSGMEWWKAAWASGEGDEPNWLEIRLPERRRGGKLRIEWAPAHASRTFVVQTRPSMDAKWAEVTRIRDNTDQQNTVPLPQEPYRSIRIYQHSGDGSPDRPKLMWISAVELTD